jgi:hypothetical protein
VNCDSLNVVSWEIHPSEKQLDRVRIRRQHLTV